MKHGSFIDIMIRAALEVAAVAGRAQDRVAVRRRSRRAQSVARATATNRSSMLPGTLSAGADRSRGAICGAVARIIHELAGSTRLISVYAVLSGQVEVVSPPNLLKEMLSPSPPDRHGINELT